VRVPMVARSLLTYLGLEGHADPLMRDVRLQQHPLDWSMLDVFQQLLSAIAPCSSLSAGITGPYRAPRTGPTSFTAELTTERIKSANQRALEGFKALKTHRAAAGPAREALDKAMAARLNAMRPLCKEFLFHRAEIAGLAHQQCRAAQGRVNAADIDDSTGPHGCAAPWPAGAQPPGTPLLLNEASCTHGSRELQCTVRLNSLKRGDPAPGELPHHLRARLPTAKGKADNDAKTTATPSEAGKSMGQVQSEPLGGSMDEEFRQWCHPTFRLHTKHIGKELARGVITGEEEELAKDS